MQHLIPKLVSQEQGGFVSGRETMEGALVAHKVLHSINSNKYSIFMVKLDMMKAYDRVKWDFLFKVLHKFGFAKGWCKWIKACIMDAWFLVLINGVLAGFFSSTQGV